MLAADATNSPVIVQASAGAHKYAGAPFLRHLILAAIEEWPHIPVVMHCKTMVQALMYANVLFNLVLASVMMDGSLGADGKTPTTYDYNVDVTRQVVAMAHVACVSVEGEISLLR